MQAQRTITAQFDENNRQLKNSFLNEIRLRCEVVGYLNIVHILVIQSSKLDPIGILGEHLAHYGAQLCTWLPEQHPSPPSGDFSGLIILGGHMNAYEDEAFPHLPQVVDFIHQFHREGKPIMGVCLGAQLIARAFGSQVSTHTAPELGFSPIQVADASATEPWLTSCPANLHLMQWHFDTFDLPEQATLLMTNHFCKHQAYRIGDNIYGFQFHLEVTPGIVMDWLADKGDWIEANYPALDREVIQQLEEHAVQSGQFAHSVARDWMSLIPLPAVTPALPV